MFIRWRILMWRSRRTLSTSGRRARSASARTKRSNWRAKPEGIHRRALLGRGKTVTISTSVLAMNSKVKILKNDASLCVFRSFIHLFCRMDTGGGGQRNKSHASIYSADGETLRIGHVSKRHMGVYYCIASNGVPPSVSKRVAVTVLCELAGHILRWISV